MGRVHRRVAAPSAGTKRKVQDTGPPCEKELVKRARETQKSAEERKSVQGLETGVSTFVSHTRNFTGMFEKTVSDILKSEKVDMSRFKTLQQRAVATGIPYFTKLDYFSLLRVPTSNEKVCSNARNMTCIGAELGPLGALVATVGKNAVQKKEHNSGECVACRVAKSQEAALMNMLCGQIQKVSSTERTRFEDALWVKVHGTNEDNECEFAPGTTWNAPYSFSPPFKSGIHYGTVHHSPLLMKNLQPSDDKMRYIPFGYAFVDGCLQRKPDQNPPNIPMTFLS